MKRNASIAHRPSRPVFGVPDHVPPATGQLDAYLMVPPRIEGNGQYGVMIRAPDKPIGQPCVLARPVDAASVTPLLDGDPIFQDALRGLRRRVHHREIHAVHRTALQRTLQVRKRSTISTQKHESAHRLIDAVHRLERRLVEPSPPLGDQRAMFRPTPGDSLSGALG